MQIGNLIRIRIVDEWQIAVIDDSNDGLLRVSWLDGSKPSWFFRARLMTFMKVSGLKPLKGNYHYLRRDTLKGNYHYLRRDTMKVGDLIYFLEHPKDWGFIVKEGTHKYKVYWYDGDISWIHKRAVKKCP